VKRQLQSNLPNDRQQAVFWLAWTDSVFRTTQKDRPNGLPILPDSVIRDLLNTIHGQNVLIGDWAFEEREVFDMNRTARPGECFEIVPALRLSAHWLSGEHDIVPVGLPVSYTHGCVTL
jgi:hypothetical protein